MPLRRLTAFTGVAVLVLGVGTAVAAEPDPVYPTGTFAVSKPGMLRGYAGCLDTPYTSSTVAVTSLVDDNTPSDRIRLSLEFPGVRYGISGLDQYGAPAGETKGIDGWYLTFDSPGTYVGKVTITDQDAHETGVMLLPITVVDDTTPATMRVALPPLARRHIVSSWRYLHGRAADPDSGLFELSADVLQRRAGIWYAYDSRAKAWRKGNRSETWTRSHVRRFPMATQRFVNGRWALPRMARLTKGLLVVRAQVNHDGSCATTFAPEIRVRLTTS